MYYYMLWIACCLPPINSIMQVLIRVPRVMASLPILIKVGRNKISMYEYVTKYHLQGYKEGINSLLFTFNNFYLNSFLLVRVPDSFSSTLIIKWVV